MRFRDLWDHSIVWKEEEGAGFVADVDDTPDKPVNRPNPGNPPNQTTPGNPPNQTTPGNDTTPGGEIPPGDTGGDIPSGSDDNDDDEGSGEPGLSPEERRRLALEALAAASEATLAWLTPVLDPIMLMNNPADFADDGSEQRIGAFVDFVVGEDWRQHFETAVEAARDLFEQVQAEQNQSLNATSISDDETYMEVDQQDSVGVDVPPAAQDTPVVDETIAEALNEGREAGFGFTADTLAFLQNDPNFLAYVAETEGVWQLNSEAIDQFFEGKTADELGALYVDSLAVSTQRLALTGSFDGLSAQEAIEQYQAMITNRLEHIEQYGGIRVLREGSSYSNPVWDVISPEDYIQRQNPDIHLLSIVPDMAATLASQQASLYGIQDTIVHRDIRQMALDWELVDPDASLPEIEAAICDYTQAANADYGIDVPEGTFQDGMTIPELAEAQQQMLQGHHGEYDPFSPREFDSEGNPIPVLTDSAIGDVIDWYGDVHAAYAGQYEPINKHPEQALLEIAASMFLEPVDWVLTVRDVVDYVGEGNYGAALATGALALLPLIPGKAGRLVDNLDDFRHVDDVPINQLDDIPPTGAIGPYSGREFDPENAGGLVRKLGYENVIISQQGIDVVESHLRRFDEGEGGPLEMEMLKRLRLIEAGEIEPTAWDRRFYTHELREFVRYRILGWKTGIPLDPDESSILWNNTHTATLEDYGLAEARALDEDNPLFHPDIWSQRDRLWEERYLGR